MRHMRRVLWYQRKVARSANLEPSRFALAVALVFTSVWLALIVFGLFLAVVQPFTL